MGVCQPVPSRQLLGEYRLHADFNGRAFSQAYEPRPLRVPREPVAEQPKSPSPDTKALIAALEPTTLALPPPADSPPAAGASPAAADALSLEVGDALEKKQGLPSRLSSVSVTSKSGASEPEADDEIRFRERVPVLTVR